MSSFLKRSIAYAAITAVIIAGAFFIAERPIVQYATDVISFVKEYSDAHGKDDLAKELRQEIFTQPLRGTVVSDSSTLSSKEIIKLTNVERSKTGAYPLAENALLDKAARDKLQDMFDKQYFEHISPSGKGPGSLAANVGYGYVVIGENLALGLFKDDQDLMRAWMNSTGHRENILNKRYLEIGVAVGRGTFKGDPVWIAVQEFGKPSSACPAIDNTLKSKIDLDKQAVASTSTDLNDKRTALESLPHSTPEESAIYNAKVTEYNNEVNEYNDMLTTLRTEIDAYNMSVEAFNTCARR